MPLYQIKNSDAFDPKDGIPNLMDHAYRLIIIDPPYGVTKNKWDTPFDIKAMFQYCFRLLETEGTLCIFAQQPFASMLITQEINRFRYELVWLKEKGTQFHESERRPLPAHESILVFSNEYPNFFIPQKTQGIPYEKTFHADTSNTNYGQMKDYTTTNDGSRYPLSYLYYPRDNGQKGIHPTQKPVELLRNLIRSYSQVQDLVLDFCMGSGSTIVAAMLEQRVGVGYEIDPVMFAKAKQRIDHVSYHGKDNIELIREMSKNPKPKGTLTKFLK